MKKIKALSALLLAFLMLVLSACGEEKVQKNTAEPKKEKATVATAEKKTEAEAEQNGVELTEADREYLKNYLANYEAGIFEGEKFFEYQRFTEFIAPFEYKGLTYPDDPMLQAEVTDEEVDDYLTLFFLSAAVNDDQYKELSEGVVQKYDLLTLDYRGEIDGVVADNTVGTDEELLIGSGSYIDGFESGLIGKKLGEEVRLDLKFSPYYGSKDVAGKDVTFYVTIKKILRPEIPEFSLDLINEYYETEFTTVEEAKVWFKDALEVKSKNQRYSLLSTYLQQKMMEDLKVVQYPEKELEHYVDHFVAYYESVKGEDTDWNVYCSETLGLSYEDFMKEAEVYAKEQILPLLMIFHIANEEGITCTSDQISAFIEGLYTTQNAEGYYPNLEAMVKECTELFGANYFETQVIGAMVSEKIVEYAVKEAV
ncbi:MAG: hypothetical protein E7580_00290 [Ruminococcaceae bacterium]|nr:hypothetical protein [Oscillospiraceae bacterium]